MNDDQRSRLFGTALMTYILAGSSLVTGFPVWVTVFLLVLAFVLNLITVFVPEKR
jgi:hypothetical protein